MPKVVPEYKEDAKRRIVEAAMEVIAERGIEGMRIDDVAKRLGVTKGAIYWYFKTRENLIGAVLNKIQHDVQKIEFELYHNRSFEETLMQMFDRYALTDDRLRAIFFESCALATRNSDIRHATREFYDGLASTFETAIKKEKRQHFLVTQTDDRKMALLMVALYSGLQNYLQVWMHQQEVRELWHEAIRILLKPSETWTYGEDR